MLSDPLRIRVPGITVAEVRCTGQHAGWSPEEPVTGFGLVLVQSGMFRRRVDGVEIVADPVSGYVQRPGSVQQIAHPRGGDLCTVIAPSATMLGSLLERPMSDEPLFTSPAFDLAHRALVARARRGIDEFELAERATYLAGGLMEILTTQTSTHHSAVNSHRSSHLVEHTRQALASDVRLRLDELARMAGVSAYHLSRTFRLVTGLTITRYRMRLRVRRVVQRLSAGDHDLARLALEFGFSDQAHLTRSLRGETGLTPGLLRSILSPRTANSH